MFLLAYACSVIFSYLYHLTTVDQLNLKYFIMHSKCDYCSRRLSWLELLPIINFIYLKGRTLCCHKKLNLNYILGEILAFVIIPLISFNHFDVYAPLFLTTFLFLLTMALYDIQTLTLNLNLVIILLIICIFIAPLHFQTFLLFAPLIHLCFLFKPHQIGYGDILLLTVLSLFYPYNFFTIFLTITFAIALIFSSIMLLIKHQHYIPLIPFILVSYVITSYFYHDIIIYL
ncbi:peptidase [Staphylococcus devriesei]|nr:peptidase [Staphylococcus devriesei]